MLNEDQVREILRRCVDGRLAGKRGHPDSQVALAREFGVPQSSISKIVHRKQYRNVRATVAVVRRPRRRNKKATKA